MKQNRREIPVVSKNKSHKMCFQLRKSSSLHDYVNYDEEYKNSAQSQTAIFGARHWKSV